MAKTAKKADAALPAPIVSVMEKKCRHQRKMDAKSRLPNGARFEVAYDAGSETWSGTLTVGSWSSTNKRSGVFTLLKALDTMYREHLKQQPA